MEFNFEPGRLAILAGLLIVFALFGGFRLLENSEGNSIRAGRAWRYCVMMYVAGAICVSIIDHTVGNLDRTNLRFLYVILGIGLMIASAYWLHAVRNAVDGRQNVSVTRLSGSENQRLSSSMRRTDRSAFARTSSGMRISGSR